MEVEAKMEYAIALADVDFAHEIEDIFKLAGLCEEIATLISAEETANSETGKEFARKVKNFHDKDGRFRSGIERLPVAKRFVESL